MTCLEKARPIRAAMDSAGQNLTDAQAIKAKGIYRQWDKLVMEGFTAEKAGYRFLYGEDLYKTVGPKTPFASQWVPGQGTESMYTRIDDTHAGTLEDPILYAGNMELQAGLYYTQDGVIYLCTNSTGQAVYSPLCDLVGIYVKEATDNDL